MNYRSIGQLLTDWADCRPKATALEGLDWRLSFEDLAHQVSTLQAELHALGIHRGDVVLSVLDDAASSAIAFLGVSDTAIYAPVHPRTKGPVLEDLVRRLMPKLVLLSDATSESASSVAASRGVPSMFVGRREASLALERSRTTVKHEAGTAPRQSAEHALYLRTSGTTGHPRIVALTHANILSAAYHMGAAMELTTNDRCLNVMPMYHVQGLLGATLATIMAGGTVQFPGPLDVRRFEEWLEALRPTWYTASPTMHRSIYERVGDNFSGDSSLRFIRSTSAPLARTLLESMEEVFSVPVVQGYGMTEAASQIASMPLPPKKRNLDAVGIPAGPNVRVLDANSHPCPPAQSGEIVVRGPTIMDGYVGAPEESVKAFTNGWLKTGDLGFLDADGFLHVTGRSKEVINRGGELISPFAVEEALRHHPEVTDAVAYVADNERLGEEVAAAVVLRRGASVSNQKILDFAAQYLSEHELPRSLRCVPAIPKTETGKPLRVGLALRAGFEPEVLTAGDCEHVPEGLRAIWRDCLASELPNAADNFFEHGGDSVLAIELLARIKSELGIECSVDHFFRNPTPAGVAGFIEAAAPETHAAIAPLGARQTTQPTLSPVQERLWFLQRVAPNSAAWNVSKAWQLRGKLDLDSLADAWRRLVNRHPPLRSVLATTNGPQLTIRPELPATVALPVTGVDSSEVRSAIERQAARPFELHRDAPARAHLFKMGPDNHMLLVTMHHIVCDARSWEIVEGELFHNFGSNRGGCLPSPLPLSARYDREAAVAATELEERQVPQLAYWTAHLQNSRFALDLSRTNNQRRGPGRPARTRHLSLEASTRQRLSSIAKKLGVTVHALFLTAFQLLLFRQTGQRELCVSIPISLRGSRHSELIGFFANLGIIKAKIEDDDSFAQAVAETHRKTAEALENRHVPFDRVVAALRRAGSIVEYDAMFTFNRRTKPVGTTEDMRVVRVPVNPTEIDCDVILELNDDGNELYGWWRYAADQLSTDTLECMNQDYVELIKRIVRSPDTTVAALTSHPGPCAQPARSTGTVSPNDDSLLLHQMFEVQARRCSHRNAIIWSEGALTYRELNERANQIAAALQASGVIPGDHVAISLRRSPRLVCAIVGVLKTGAAFVPVEQSAPRLHIDKQLGLAGVSVAIVEAGSLAPGGLKLIRLEDVEGLAPRKHSCPALEGISTACIYFTSGSTGQPRAVRVSHRAVVNQLRALADRPGFSENDVFFASTTIAFDPAVVELLLPLAVGGQVAMADEKTLADGVTLAEALREMGATVMQATPTRWRMLLQSGWRGTPALVAWSGGEALTQSLAEKLLSRCRSVWNLYGPTETTVWSTAHHVHGADDLAIGFPLSNYLVELRDDAGRLTAGDATGEIFISGPGVADGYVGDQVSTRKKFVELKTDGSSQRFCRTGDLGRRRRDGALQWLGRLDNQVKVRGRRVALEEIEHALLAHSLVDESVVIPVEKEPSSELAAYYAPASVRPRELRVFLAERLPKELVPSRLLPLDILPRTPRGKVDRKALNHRENESTSEPALASCEVSREIAVIWQSLLGVEHVARSDDFFALGGHSLLAMRVVALIEETLNIEVSVSEIFEATVFEDLVELVKSGRRRDDSSEDFKAAVLDTAIVPAQDRAQSISRVLLTGATGFLGSFILETLMTGSKCEVSCLIRCEDEAHGRQKLQTAAAKFGCGDPTALDRVEIVRGDLKEPLLGLTPALFQNLGGRIDSILHAGADVDFIRSARMLWPSNVLGAEEILRLAGTRRTKHVHLVSSIAAEAVDAGFVAGGYEATKLAAESLAEAASKRGFPVSIYRVGTLTAHRNTSGTKPGDLFQRRLEGYVRFNLVPQLERAIDLTPVDYAAEVLASLARSANPKTGTFSISNPYPHARLVAVLREVGHPVREVPHGDWVASIESTPEHPLYPFLTRVRRGWFNRDALSDRPAASPAPPFTDDDGLLAYVRRLVPSVHAPAVGTALGTHSPVEPHQPEEPDSGIR